MTRRGRSPPPSATSPTSDWASRVTSRAILPRTPVTPAHAPAISVIRSRSVCQGTVGVCRPSSAASSAATSGPRSPSADRVPAAPPNWTASRLAATRSSAVAASSRPVSQPAATRPKVTGTACWSRVRPIMMVSRCTAARRAAAAAAAARSSEITPSAWRASSMAAVSTMSWLVAPWCTAPAGPGGSIRVSARTSAGTGLPVSAACRPSSAASNASARAAVVTAAPAPGAAIPACSSARARAASVSSMACSQAWSEVSTAPRPNTPSKSPWEVCTACSCESSRVIGLPARPTLTARRRRARTQRAHISLRKSSRIPR